MTAATEFEFITKQDQLLDFCGRMASSKFVGFDTEFVSENRYKPELCLVQVATDDEFAIIDTIEVDSAAPFWEALADGDHISIAHAAREEFNFCFRSVGRRPAQLFDVQLAAGMVGLEYPASYANLVHRILGKTVDKGETRTDWAKRPLTDRQMEYAIQDVVHLKPLYSALTKKLESMNRVSWMWDEMTAWQDGLTDILETPQWHRVSGTANLNRKALAIVRELWLWRDDEARRRDRLPKRVLPDDLIVELSKRGTSEVERLKAIRGFDKRVAKSAIPEISDAIEKALELPKDQYPQRPRRNKSANLGLLGQFIAIALKIVCREEKIAPSIVGTTEALKNFAAWRLGLIKFDTPPELATGWRKELVGSLVEKILDGELSIAVDDPKAEHPLKLQKN